MAQLTVNTVDQFGSVPAFAVASASGDSVSLEDSGIHTLAIRNATGATREINFRAKNHPAGSYSICFKIPPLGTFCLALSIKMLGRQVAWTYNTSAGLTVAVVRTVVR